MDLAILYWIQATMAGPLMDTIMPVFSILGNNGALWLVLAVLMFASKRHKEYGVLMIAALIAAFLIGDWVVKPLVARPRPFIADPSIVTLLIDAPSGYSFPSTHAIVAFAAVTVLLFSRVEKLWKVLFFVLALCISFARLYLCVEYPSDVLAGILLGVAIGLLAVFVGGHFYVDQAVKDKKKLAEKKEAPVEKKRFFKIR